MRPPEVLDQQAALIDYLDSRAYADYVTGFAQDMARKNKLASPADGTQICQTLRRALTASQAFHVQTEMMPLIRAAAIDLDDDDYLIHNRLPAENGFLIFDQPWRTTDAWGDTVSLTALQWRHGTLQGTPDSPSGLWLTFYTDINDETDTVTQTIINTQGIEAARSLGRLHLAHLDWLPYATSVGPTEIVTDEEYAQYATEGLTLTGKSPNLHRLVVALFLLLNQVIVEIADAPIDRDTLRRITRKNLPVRVQTIKLRRKQRITTTDTHGTGTVDWQHQWPVRGHWAWRACNADHPTAEPYEKGWRTRTYVAPYWKGPEDKPILLTDKVWGLAQ